MGENFQSPKEIWRCSVVILIWEHCHALLYKLTRRGYQLIYTNTPFKFLYFEACNKRKLLYAHYTNLYYDYTNPRTTSEHTREYQYQHKTFNKVIYSHYSMLYGKYILFITNKTNTLLLLLLLAIKQSIFIYT